MHKTSILIILCDYILKHTNVSLLNMNRERERESKTKRDHSPRYRKYLFCDIAVYKRHPHYPS